MNATRDVSIIIPFYNRSALLEQCLISVIGNTDETREVTVVDDSAEPAERHACQALCSRYGVRRLTTPENQGFIGATKRGAQATDRPYLLFLNSDTEATAWGWLEHLAAPLAHKRVGVVGAKLIFPDGRIQHAGVARAEGGWPFHPFMGQPGDTPAANIYRGAINAVTGGCFLVRRSLWDKLGGWDEQFGRGVFEDVDFCWRAIAAGFRVAYQPKACLIHHQSASIEPDGTHSLHLHSAENGEKLRARWGKLDGDEHLFGLPKQSVQFALTLDPRLVGLLNSARQGDPRSRHALHWLVGVLHDREKKGQIEFQSGMLAVFEALQVAASAGETDLLVQ